MIFGFGERGHTNLLTRALAEAAGVPCLDLAGRTTLWTLGALVDGAACVVCNDTGISHIAAARGRPSGRG